MILSALLAASFTFTATATGVEKGAAVEFVFAGPNTDRDYETMFVIDGSVDEFCAKFEKAGIPRGRPVDASRCRLWPVGCALSFDPPIEKFVSGKMPEGLPPAVPIYTGGERLSSGLCDASTNMPASVFSVYSLSQSPIVYNGIYEQGVVYNAFQAKDALKKGERFSFTVSWDERTFPKTLSFTVGKTNALDVVKRLRAEAEKGELDVTVAFGENLSVEDAQAVANALSMLDSPRIKINGVSNVFYRTFMPLVKWLDRKERLVQPFELTLGDPDKLVFIEEDWTVDGPDPKLTLREIPFADAAKHPKTDTCFIFCDKQTTVSRVLASMAKLKASRVKNWYVFTR